MSLVEMKTLISQAESQASRIESAALERSQEIISSAKKEAKTLEEQAKVHAQRTLSKEFGLIEKQLFQCLKNVCEQVLLAEIKLQPTTIEKRIKQTLDSLGLRESEVSSVKNTRKGVSTIEFEEFSIELDPRGHMARIFDALS